MKAAGPGVIAVLPVGELDSDLARSKYEAITGALKRLGASLVTAAPVSVEDHAQQAVAELGEKAPDLLVIVPLRGLSAPVIEAALRASAAPRLIWPVEGTYALPSSLLAMGALRETRGAIALHYAPPDNPVSAEKVDIIFRAAKAFSRLRQSRIGVIGGLFPNLVGCQYDPRALTSRLGVVTIPISFEEIRNALRDAAGRHDEMDRLAPVPSADPASFARGVDLHLALKHIAQERSLDAFAAECWSAFPRELGLNPCLGFIEDAYTLACEGNVLLCISLLLTRYITGGSAYAGDLIDLDLQGVLTLVHCGGPASLASSPEDVVLGRSQLAAERGFETLTCRPVIAAGPATVYRLYGASADQLHLAQGELVNCTTSPNLEAKIQLSGDRWDFLSHCFGNHYVMTRGDIRRELTLVCKWLGISVFET